MGTIILKRLIETVPVLFLVSLIIFYLVHLTPGDPALLMLGEEATPDKLATLRHQLALDQPIPVQYGIWLSNVMRGDLGRSVRTQQPVVEAIAERLPPTMELTILAMIISLCIAMPTGIISAVRRNSALDFASTTVSLFGISMPNFFLAILLIFVFALKLRWLPPIGYTPITADWIANLKGMILPALTLGAATAAVISRQLRSSLLEVLSQEYIRTAQAKGLAERMIVLGHGMKNALIPVATVIGLQIGALLGGAIITESIFVLPGVGRLLVDSIFARDFPLVQGAVLFLALVYLFANLAVDVVYVFLDPRIRYE
jgi:peptide/nickel transport system permease protein